jgi:hypothetical protein
MNVTGLWDQLVDAVCRPPRDDAYSDVDLVGGRRAAFRWVLLPFGHGAAGCLPACLPACMACTEWPAAKTSGICGCRLYDRRYYRQDVTLVSPGPLPAAPHAVVLTGAWVWVDWAPLLPAPLPCALHPTDSSPSRPCSNHTAGWPLLQENKRGLKLQCSHYRPCVVTSSDGSLPCVVYCHCASSPAAGLPCCS